MAAKKKNRKSALKDSEPLVPIAFDSIPLGLDGEETSSVAPAAKGWRDICSSEEHEDMVKVSLSAKFDEELPEVGKPDTDHDLEAMEGGKAAADNISSRSSDAFDIDTPQASQSESISENRATLDGDSYLDTFNCDYLTPIVHVYVGSKEMRFLVHRGVLAQSSSLASKCKRTYGNETLRLPEVEPRLFVLLLTYLYQRDYQTSPPAESVNDGPRDDAAALFKTHAKIYCLAGAYNLGHLVEESIKKMEAVGRVEFRSLVEIAREVYPETQADDIWFKNYFKNEVTRALTETPNIAKEQCILDIYKNDGGRLAVDLFTTIINQYANHGAKVVETVAGSGAPSESVSNMDETIHQNRVQHPQPLEMIDSGKDCEAYNCERDHTGMVRVTVVSDVGYLDHLATSQHAALDDTVAEVPRIPSNVIVECSSEGTPVVDLQVIRDLSLEKQEEDFDDGYCSPLDKKKGRMQKTSAVQDDNLDSWSMSKKQEVRSDNLDPWSMWDTEKGKKEINPAAQDDQPDSWPPPPKQQEVQDDTGGGMFGMKNGQKGKKQIWWGVQDDGLDSLGLSKPQEVQDDNLDSSWVTSTKKKKKNKSKPKEPEQFIDDTWGFSTSSKKKKPLRVLPDEQGYAIEPNPYTETEAPSNEVECPFDETPPPAEVLGPSADFCDAEPLVQSCDSRMSHLTHESGWSRCTLCRRELNHIAQKLVLGGVFGPLR